MKESDLKEVSLLHMECFNEAPYFSKLSLESAFENLKSKYDAASKGFCLVKKDNEKVVAYLLVTKHVSKDNKIEFYIGPLGVKKEYRGSKLGVDLMKEAMSKLKGEKADLIFLRIDIKAPYLLEYYSRLGFKRYGEVNGKVYMRLNAIK